MRGINYLAAFGTILVFIGIFLFKAGRKTVIHLKEGEKKIQPRNFLFVVAGILSIIFGFVMIIKATKII